MTTRRVVLFSEDQGNGSCGAALVLVDYHKMPQQTAVMHAYAAVRLMLIMGLRTHYGSNNLQLQPPKTAAAPAPDVVVKVSHTILLLLLTVVSTILNVTKIGVIRVFALFVCLLPSALSTPPFPPFQPFPANIVALCAINVGLYYGSRVWHHTTSNHLRP